jgi:hypothetical protein
LRTHYEKTARAATKIKARKLVSSASISNEEAATLHATLEDRGVDWAVIKQGANPLDGKRAPQFLSVMVDKLLTGPVNKTDMINLLTADLCISERLARRYLNIGTSILGAEEIIDPAEYIMEILT